MKHTFRSTNRSRSGFTLMELLIVMAVLIIIMAILMPIMWGRYNQTQISNARMQIKNFEDALELFRLDRGDYPRTLNGSDGLQYLIGVVPTQQQVPGSQGVDGPQIPGVPGIPGGSGLPGQDSGFPGPMDTSTGFPGDSTGFPGSLDSASSVGTGAPADFGALPGGSDPTGGFGTGALDPTSGLGTTPGIPGAPGTEGLGPNDGTSPGVGTGSGAPLAGLSTRKGAGANYLGVNVLPKDPWKNEYRYEYPTLRRPDISKPAVWSVGPDGIDDTDDDIIGWQSELDELDNNPQLKARYEAQRARRSATNPANPNEPGIPGIPGPGGNTGSPDSMFGPGEGGVGTPDSLFNTPPTGTGTEGFDFTTSPTTDFNTPPSN